MGQYLAAKNPKPMLRRLGGGGRGARWGVEGEGCGVAPAESSLQFVSRCRQCR